MATETNVIASSPSSPAASAKLLAQLEDFRHTGSECAFEAIVRAYAGMVYAVCLGVLKNAHDAEDAAQATFLSLATQVKLGKPVNYLGPWLRQVAKRTSLDYRKSRIRRERREAKHGRESANQMQPHEGERVMDGETYRIALHEELEKLPERYREPLKLHYLGGLKAEEAALELNCKPQTLAVRLHRGRKLLASGLSKRGMFLTTEKVGLPLTPAIRPALKAAADQINASAAMAVSHSLNTHDVVSLISSQVMSILRSTSKINAFTKLKVVLIIMIGLGPLIASGQQLSRALSNAATHWPSLHFDFAKMLRSMLPTLGTISSANSNSSSPAQKSPVADPSNIALLKSFTPLDDLTNQPPTISLASLPVDVPLAGRLPTQWSEVQPPTSAMLSLDRHATIDLASPGFALQTAGSSATPEPGTLLTVSLGALIAIRRRRHA